MLCVTSCWCCSCGEDTQSDYVEFSNFNVELMDRKMRRMCGTKSSDVRNDVTSDGNFFRVTFKSNDAYDATGFESFYQFRKYEGWLLCHVYVFIYYINRTHIKQKLTI